jgi:hypothetical protein
MSMLIALVAALAACNMHLCVYGAFGAALLVRAYLAARNNRNELAREDAVIGLVHLMLALV